MPSDRTTTNGTSDLVESLRALGLWLVADELDDFIARATKNRNSVRQVLEDVARLELQERARKSVERRLRRSRVGRFKPMADFDWEWPNKIDRGTVERVLTMGFMERSENVILVASQGLGKTMLAKNLVHAAAQRGASAVFTTAADLLLDLSKQETARALERRLRYYTQPQVLAIDEVGGSGVSVLRQSRGRSPFPDRVASVRAAGDRFDHQPGVFGVEHGVSERRTWPMIPSGSGAAPKRSMALWARTGSWRSRVGALAI